MENGDHVCSLEPAAGGVNVFSCAESDVSTADHLVVMVNGILGRLASYTFSLFFFSFRTFGRLIHKV